MSILRRAGSVVATNCEHKHSNVAMSDAERSFNRWITAMKRWRSLPTSPAHFFFENARVSKKARSTWRTAASL